MFRSRARGAVAARALEHRIVRRIRVASGAHSIGVPVIEREEGVIGGRQSRRNPRRRGMAGSAGGRPSRRHMVRIRGPGEIRLMAGVTSRRRAGKNIVDVALDAINRGVRAGQREGRAVVIERGPGPCSGRMAGIARGGKPRRGVSRIGGAVPIGLMAAIAGGGQGCVVVIGVALCAGQGRMRPG